MAFISGRNTKLLSDEYDLGGFLNQVDKTQEAALLDTTTFGQTSRTFITGFKSGTLSVAGFWDGSAAAIDVVLQAALGAVSGQIVTVGPDGLAVGKRIQQLLSRLTRYGISEAVDSVVAVSGEMQADGGIDYGVSLHDLAAETATGNSTSVDNGAASTNGGVAHLHLTAITAAGGDTLDVKIQHSTNDSTWVDLVTFTQLTTALAKERIVVAAGTTVNRYLRGLWTKGGVGSPSYTFHVGFSRR